MNPSDHQRGFTGFWLPVEIIDATELSWTQRLIWAEIHALCKGPKGICFATNRHFEERFDVCESTVKQSIAALQNAGWLESNIRGPFRTLEAKWPENLHSEGGKKLPPRGQEITPKGVKNYPHGNKEKDQLNANGNPPHTPPADLALKFDDTKGSTSSEPAETIYSAYPRRCGKPAALKAIRAALKTTPFEILLGHTRSYAAAISLWPVADRQFVPHPATWFNQRRWEDAETFAVRAARGPAAAGVFRPGYNQAPVDPNEDPTKL